MRRVIMLLLVVLATIPVLGQAVITGLVTDEAGAIVEGADVYIDGTDYYMMTEIDGRYSLEVAPGEYELTITSLGFQETKQKVTVQANKEVVLDIILPAEEQKATQKLQGLTVTSEASSGQSEAATLNIQKKSIEIKEVKGAAELSRTGVSDAKAAFTKVSGITTLEGSQNVFVRGLGDRYNSTTLNGLPLPSNEPEYKNISLQFFSTGIISSIDVSKTFSSRLNGDVAGAALNINTKDFKGKPYIKLGLSSGVNTNAIKEKDFYLPSGANWFGVQQNTKSKVNSLTSWPFTTSSDPRRSGMPLNLSLSLNGGKRFTLADGMYLSWFVALSSNHSYGYQDGFAKTVNNVGGPLNYYESAKKYSYAVNDMASSNLVFKLPAGHKIKLNTIFIHDNKQAYYKYFGNLQNVSEEKDDYALYLRQQEDQNLLFVNQLFGDFKLGKSKLNLGVSYNKVYADQPDRKGNLVRYNSTENKYYTTTGSAAYNQRYYQNLKENDLSAKATFKTPLLNDKLKVQLGAEFRKTKRDFSSLAYYFDFSVPRELQLHDLDAMFNQENLAKGYFKIKTSRGAGIADQFLPFTYEGDRKMYSGFASFNWEATDKLLLTAGVRMDKIDQKVTWDTNLSNSNSLANRNKGKIDKVYVLPNLNVKYSIEKNNILRLAASKTYTLPQFKELAPFLYESPTINSYGNADLEVSDNYNVDAKWELYPQKGEIYSVGVYGKYIQNPINRYAVPSAADELSYVNSKSAIVAGVEVELKRKLYQAESMHHNYALSLGFNAAYLYSNQKYDKTKAKFTNKEGRLQGASPVIVNTDLSLTIKNSENKHKKTVASVVFTYASDKVYAVGTQDNQDIIEKGIPLLNFVFQHSFNKRIGFNIKARNILNSAYERTKEVYKSTQDKSFKEVVVRKYKRGLDFSLGFNYKF